MTKKIDRICDNCHESAAIHHTFYGQTGQTKSLCAACHDKLTDDYVPQSRRSMEAVLASARCQYCGDPAVDVSVHYGVSGVANDIMHSCCGRCRADLTDFANRPENAIPDFDADDEASLEQASQLLEERTRRQEDFMRERVRTRRGLR